MADDLGYEGIGCFGNDSIETPALDQMAKNGMLLTDYHSNGAVCSPTRAAMLTGKYQQRVGLEGVIYARGPTRQAGLDTTVSTLSKVLAQNGYQTLLSGKWHLGYAASFNPIHHGFDQFYGYVSGNIDFHSHYDNTGVFDWYHNLDTIQEQGYVTDLITRHALHFLDAHQSEPFFMYIPHQAPHVPFQGRSDPPYRFRDNEFTYYGPVKDRKRAYREMIEVMDEGIGQILNRVDELGLAGRTLIVFVSDNGAETFGHNGSLRGAKGSLYEGGHRVPAIVQWKGHIEGGTQSDATIMSFDWMPTFLTLAQIDLDHLKLDGQDISRHLLEHADLPPRTLFWKYRNQLAVRDGPYKLMISEQDTVLFNLDVDLNEQKDISEEEVQIQEELTGAAKDWISEMEMVSQKTR